MKLSKERRISIYHSPILIEETIRMYLKDHNKEELKRQLPFIFEICQERWFRDRVDCWVEELVEEAGSKESIFLPDRERRTTEDNIRKMVFLDDFDQSMFDTAFQQMDENRIKAGKIKQTAVKMREDTSEKLKAIGKSRKDIKQTPDEYVAATLDEFGSEIIKKHLPVTNASEIAEKWKARKDRYPYFTLFSRGFLYSGYYAMAYPNEPIDLNAMVDVSQLCYVNGVDLLVSNDEKFMKKAFDFMFEGQPKEMMTAENFGVWLKANYE